MDKDDSYINKLYREYQEHRASASGLETVLRAGIANKRARHDARRENGIAELLAYAQSRRSTVHPEGPHEPLPRKQMRSVAARLRGLLAPLWGHPYVLAGGSAALLVVLAIALMIGLPETRAPGFAATTARIGAVLNTVSKEQPLDSAGTTARLGLVETNRGNAAAYATGQYILEAYIATETGRLKQRSSRLTALAGLNPFVKDEPDWRILVSGAPTQDTALVAGLKSLDKVLRRHFEDGDEQLAYELGLWTAELRVLVALSLSDEVVPELSAALANAPYFYEQSRDASMPTDIRERVEQSLDRLAGVDADDPSLSELRSINKEINKLDTLLGG